mmetsp:Transcript_134453/g.190089  ORF Transcript_134453/g.190089 Transcript_134453/m.190089 type:complete len:108 (+) Transcript_134453:960-1283(+)
MFFSLPQQCGLTAAEARGTVQQWSAGSLLHLGSSRDTAEQLRAVARAVKSCTGYQRLYRHKILKLEKSMPFQVCSLEFLENFEVDALKKFDWHRSELFPSMCAAHLA